MKKNYSQIEAGLQENRKFPAEIKNEANCFTWWISIESGYASEAGTKLCISSLLSKQSSKVPEIADYELRRELLKDAKGKV